MSEDSWAGVDEDAIVAAADLVGRSGARDFEIGYDDDDPQNVTWYAVATYNGAKLMRQGFTDPVAAIESLARRLLAGAQCRRCGKPIALAGPAKSKKTCRWTRRGAKWEPGCGKPIDESIPVPGAQLGK